MSMNKAEVLRIINKCRMAMGWKRQSPDESAEMVETWCELFDVAGIRTEELDAVFKAAFEMHADTGRDLNAGLIVKAYKEAPPKGPNGLPIGYKTSRELIAEAYADALTWKRQPERAGGEG